MSNTALNKEFRSLDMLELIKLKDIDFGGCHFKYSADDASLLLHSRDIHGVGHIHRFHLPGSFLVNIGGNFWRLVTGVGDASKARHLFEDAGINIDERINALRELGVPILTKEEGMQNLDRYQLPVKRLLLTA